MTTQNENKPKTATSSGTATPKKSTTTKPKPKSAPKAEMPAETPIVVKDIDPDQFVTVYNGSQGRLVYVSGRTGEYYGWDSFGSEQEMTLRELRNAKNSHKAFFVNNWFMFRDPWIIDYLGVKQYYRGALTLDEFDNVFELPADEMAEVLSKLSDGQKKSLSYRARQLIMSGEIDSLKAIRTLESVLGIELIED